MVRSLNIFTRSIRYQETGFTLVELLIALAILGLAAAAVLLNAPPPNQSARQEAERFAARVKAASTEAIVSGEIIGLDFLERGYQFSRFRRGEWEPIDRKVLSTWQLQGTVDIDYEITETVDLKSNERASNQSRSITISSVEKQKIDNTPQIRFQPIGEGTPFQVVFRSTIGKRPQRWRVNLFPSGDIEVKRYDTIAR